MADAGVLEDLAAADTAMSQLLEQIDQRQWASPTPCSEWSVRQVVGHLVGTNLTLVALFTGQQPPDRDQDHLGADPVGAYRASARVLFEVMSAPGFLEQVGTTRLGTATGAVRAQWRTADLLTHHWDLTQATGLTTMVAEQVVARALRFVQAELPKQPRTGRFDEPQPINADAPAIGRLAAFTGRTVPWRGRG